MVAMELEYQGDLHCRAAHGPSGRVLETDAPVDNQGRGESFSPTDLLATALGTCILTVMGIAARTHGVDFAGATARVEKEMATAPLRRVGRLTVEVRVPGEVSAEDQLKLERAAHTCPVHKSLHPDVEVLVRFQWGTTAVPTPSRG